MRAYDLAFGPSVDQLSWHPQHARPARLPDAEQAGWTGPNGPSIPVESWPRGSRTGLPMWHALTIELPEEYRARGPELVGLSFFQGEGQFAEEDEDIEAAMSGEPLEGEADDDPFLRQLAETAGREHPQLARLEDIIGGESAILWLTREELEGPRTAPPADPRLEDEWEAEDEGPNAWDAEPSEEQLVWIGERVGDVNAGRRPEERSVEASDNPDAYRDRDWADEGEEPTEWQRFCEEANGRMHLGGTAFCVQALPDLSPRYLEIEEFGELNFGGGNAQYCLETDNFDWAC